MAFAIDAIRSLSIITSAFAVFSIALCCRDTNGGLIAPFLRLGPCPEYTTDEWLAKYRQWHGDGTADVIYNY
jgi:hypothetical protein